MRDGKGLKARDVPLNRTARQALQSYLAMLPPWTDQTVVFRSKRGTPLAVRSVQAITRLADQASIDRIAVSAHTLRHTAVAHLQQHPGKLRQLAYLLGHESLDTTAIYTRPSPDVWRRPRKEPLNVFDLYPLGASECVHHASSAMAVSLPPHPSDEELAFDWTLSARDLAFILAHRGPENLCRLAVQLCVLRKHGRFLTSLAHVSPGILGYLCRQLDLPPWATLSGRGRDNTEGDYQRRIAAYLGWQPFDGKAIAGFRSGLSTKSRNIFTSITWWSRRDAAAWLHRILPGPASLSVRSANAPWAEYLIFERLAQLPIAGDGNGRLTSCSALTVLTIHRTSLCLWIAA